MSRAYYTDADMSSFWQPPRVDRSGRAWAMAIYILYGLAFFTAFPALIGVVLAYRQRRRHGLRLREAFDWQIRIFWTGVLASLAIGLTHAAAAGLAAVTFGLGAVFLVIPWALTAVWLVWTLWAVLRGISALR